ncbi:MAG: dihydropteroate synthase [Planctomycetota bacterium]
MPESHHVELRIGSTLLQIGRKPVVMGILNVTPDSFSDGGNWVEPTRAIEHAERMVEEGADWIDVGGESTRPGAEPVSEQAELWRVLPIVEALARRLDVPISIDTYKAEVARQAIQAGASIINDVMGFRDPRMREVGAGCQAACVCMHMIGTPQDMAQHASYGDVVGELVAFFERRIQEMKADGIDAERVVLDPGIGFAKKCRHNVEIVKRLEELVPLHRPILLGMSRKRMIGELTGRREIDRLHGSIGSAVVGYLHGARIFRVHDVAPTRDALAVAEAIESA